MAAPVSTGAVSTAATAISAPAATAAATPLAHVQPHPSPPTAEPPATQFADPGQVRHEHAPQHLPCTDPPQTQSPHARQSPAAQSSPPTPAPVTLDPGPARTAPSDTTPRTGNSAVQMLGFGPPGPVPAPAAPSLPLPRDPTPPPMPVDPKDMSAEQALAEWAQVNAGIRAWNTQCGVENVGPLPPAQYNACIASRGPLLQRQTAIRARLNDLGIPIEGEPALAPRGRVHHAAPCRYPRSHHRPPPPRRYRPVSSSRNQNPVLALLLNRRLIYFNVSHRLDREGSGRGAVYDHSLADRAEAPRGDRRARSAESERSRSRLGGLAASRRTAAR